MSVQRPDDSGIKAKSNYKQEIKRLAEVKGSQLFAGCGISWLRLVFIEGHFKLIFQKAYRDVVREVFFEKMKEELKEDMNRSNIMSISEFDMPEEKKAELKGDVQYFLHKLNQAFDILKEDIINQQVLAQITKIRDETKEVRNFEGIKNFAIEVIKILMAEVQQKVVDRNIKNFIENKDLNFTQEQKIELRYEQMKIEIENKAEILKIMEIPVKKAALVGQLLEAIMLSNIPEAKKMELILFTKKETNLEKVEFKNKDFNDFETQIPKEDKINKKRWANACKEYIKIAEDYFEAKRLKDMQAIKEDAAIYQGIIFEILSPDLKDNAIIIKLNNISNEYAKKADQVTNISEIKQLNFEYAKKLMACIIQNYGKNTYQMNLLKNKIIPLCEAAEFSEEEKQELLGRNFFITALLTQDMEDSMNLEEEEKISDKIKSELLNTINIINIRYKTFEKSELIQYIKIFVDEFIKLAKVRKNGAILATLNRNLTAVMNNPLLAFTDEEKARLMEMSQRIGAELNLLRM